MRLDPTGLAVGHIIAESMVLIHNLINPLRVNYGHFEQESRDKFAQLSAMSLCVTPLCGCVPSCRHTLLACVLSIKCCDSHLSVLPLPYRSAALKQWLLTFEARAEKKPLIGAPVIPRAQYYVESRASEGH